MKKLKLLLRVLNIVLLMTSYIVVGFIIGVASFIINYIIVVVSYTIPKVFKNQQEFLEECSWKDLITAYIKEMWSNVAEVVD